MTPLELLNHLQGSNESLAEVIGNKDYLDIRSNYGEWRFGMDTLRQVEGLFPKKASWPTQTIVARLNGTALNAMWFKTPHGYLVGINGGLVDAIRLIAHDVFGELEVTENWPIDRTLTFPDGAHTRAADRIRHRIGAFLEMGFPLGLDQTVPADGPPSSFVTALVATSLQFVVLHEVTHLVLGHDQKPVAMLQNISTPAQLATYSIAQEMQADDVAVRLHMRLGDSDSSGIRFAGVVLFFSVLSLFERYSRYQQAYDTPHQHPPAFERLYRLRMAIQFGDGDRYFGLPTTEGVRLARADVPADPLQLEVADMLSSDLIRVFRAFEADSDGPPSPIMTALNRNSDRELTQDDIDIFFEEIVRWIVLGSPTRVARHLAELHHHAVHDLNERNVREGDLQLFKNATILINVTIERLENLDHALFQTATKEFHTFSGHR